MIEVRFNFQRGAFRLDVSFSVRSKGITALYGPSGCGKTTLLRAMAGLETAPGGFFRIDDTVWQDGRKFVKTHKRSLGYIFQEPGLFSHLSVRENLEYGYKRTPDSEKKISFEKAVNLLDLKNLLSRDTAKLSGGEQQRVAIARALLASPRLLLMDEPLSALDSRRKKEILPFFEALKEDPGIPIFYVSHSAEEVARLADHMLLMDSGKIIASGTVQDVMTDLELPVISGSEAASVIEGTVRGYEERYHIAQLHFDGGTLYFVSKKIQDGTKMRLRVLAKDVSISLEKQENTSILNIFHGTIVEIQEEPDARVMVKLLCGKIPVLARITKKSSAGLGLVPGMNVFVQIKSVAVMS